MSLVIAFDFCLALPLSPLPLRLRMLESVVHRAQFNVCVVYGVCLFADANFYSAVDGSNSQTVSGVVNVGPASSAMADVSVSAPAAGVYVKGEVITVSSSLSRVSAPAGAVAGASVDFLLTDANGNVLVASGKSHRFVPWVAGLLHRMSVGVVCDVMQV